MKTCSKCKQTLALSFFGKRKRNSDGLQARCRPCFNEDARMVYSLRVESGWKYGRNSWYKRKYGITYEEKKIMFERQSGKCLIGGEEMSLDNKCHVDHDHRTGVVRGLLCSKCNIGLHYIENKEFMKKAKEYLK